MDILCDFQPRQIVYLENGNQRLYAEVIQVVETRQMCWVRPLLLVTFPLDDTFEHSPRVTDLRLSADLFWSSSLFRPAVDTDVIPFLVGLATEPADEGNLSAKSQLNQFVQRVWQADQDDTHNSKFKI